MLSDRVYNVEAIISESLFKKKIPSHAVAKTSMSKTTSNWNSTTTKSKREERQERANASTSLGRTFTMPKMKKTN
jgi:hypothetical protein